LQYLPGLEKEGISVELSSLFDDGYLEARFRHRRLPVFRAAGGGLRRLTTLARAGRFDVGWWAYELYPFMPSQLEGALWPSRIPYVLDLDDATFHLYDGSSHSLIRRLLGHKLMDLGRRAQAVLAGSEYLVDYFSRAGARVHHVPTVVDTSHYVPGPARERRGRDVVVGWMGSPVTAPYLDAVAEPLRRFQQETRAKVRLIGAGRSAPSGVDAEARDWSEPKVVAELQDMDIGIMPLPDEPFARGKCAFKLVQYMACGVPVIASPVGANTALVEQSGGGLLARGSEEWFEALLELHRSPEARHRAGADGRAYVSAHYSMEAMLPRVTRVLVDADRGGRLALPER
jgi:glycosyltransferase involved in cell wall biosynthesis